MLGRTMLRPPATSVGLRTEFPLAAAELLLLRQEVSLSERFRRPLVRCREVQVWPSSLVSCVDVLACLKNPEVHDKTLLLRVGKRL